MNKQKVLQLIQDGFPKLKIQKFIDTFNEEENKRILELYDKNIYEKYTFNDWYRLSEICKNDKEMQIAIVSHPSVPDDIIFKIISNKSYQDVYLAIVQNQSRKMPENVMKVCLDKINKKTLSRLFKWGTLNESIDSVNQSVYDVICAKALREAYNDSERKFSDIELHCFNFFYKDTSLGLLKEILKRDDFQEKFVTAIANNKNLPEEIRNMAFDKGTYYLWISNTTPYMLQNIYEATIDIAMHDKATGMVDTIAQSLSATTLINLMENDMPFSYRFDMASRYSDIANKALPRPEMLSSLIVNSPEDEIIKKIANSDFKDRSIIDNISRNKNVLDETAMPIVRKSVNHCVYSRPNILDITNVVTSLRFRKIDDDIYETLLSPLKSENKEKVEELMQLYSDLCHYNTPVEILQRLSDDIKHYNDNVYLYSTIICEAKKYGFSDKDIDLIKSLLEYYQVFVSDNLCERDIAGIMYFFSDMKEKYSSNHIIFDAINQVQQHLYEYSQKEYQIVAIENAVLKNKENINQKYELYLYTDKMSKILQDAENKISKISGEIYIEYAEEFEFPEEQKYEDFIEF